MYRCSRGLQTWPRDPFRFAALLAFTTAFLLDALVTLWAQGDLWWYGYHLVTDEGNPVAEAVLRSGPVLAFAFGISGVALAWTLATWLPKWAVAGFAAWYVAGHTLAASGWLAHNRGVGPAIATAFALGVAALAFWAGAIAWRRRNVSRTLLLAGPLLSIAVLAWLVLVCWTRFEPSPLGTPFHAAQRYEQMARFAEARELYLRDLAALQHRPVAVYTYSLCLSRLEAKVGRANEAQHYLVSAELAMANMDVAERESLEPGFRSTTADVLLDIGDTRGAADALATGIAFCDRSLGGTCDDAERDVVTHARNFLVERLCRLEPPPPV